MKHPRHAAAKTRSAANPRGSDRATERLSGTLLGTILVLGLQAGALPARAGDSALDRGDGSAVDQTSSVSQLERETTLISAQEAELAQLERGTPVLSYRIEELNRQILAVEKRLIARRRDVRRRVVALYRQAYGGYLQLLLSIGTGSEALLRQASMRWLLARDVSELRTHRHRLARLQLERGQLQQQHDRQLSRMQSLRGGRHALRAERQRLTARVAQLARQTQALRAPSRELTAEETSLLRQVDQLRLWVAQPEGLARAKHVLPWPVVGRVVGRFGAQLEPQTKLPVARSGLTVRCARLAEVRAVEAGTVRISGPLEGYGRVVLVEHAGPRYSLYGFLAATEVEPGQPVQRLTRLGTAGTDPLDARPALYFEWRQGSDPVDPLPWLRPAPPTANPAATSH